MGLSILEQFKNLHVELDLTMTAKGVAYMKKSILLVLVLTFILVLAGCTSRFNRTTDTPEVEDIKLNERYSESSSNLKLEAESDCLEPVPLDSISQDVYNALQNEWDSWNLLSTERKMFSSHTPGYCLRSFDSWGECEYFLGFTIPNALEDCSWLEKATYVAMPLGFQDASHVRASWYGTEDGHVEWINVEADYRNGDIRVMINAALYGDLADTKPSGSEQSVNLERQSYMANIDIASSQITSNSTENYFSNVAYQVNGNVLYRFNIVGEPDVQTQVENTLEQVINSFSN